MNLFQNTNTIIEKGEGYITISTFIYYPKLKDNPNGDPIPKQGDRTTLIPRKNAITMEKNGKKYYLKEDLYINHYQPAKIEKTVEYIKSQLQKMIEDNDLTFLPFSKKVAIESLIFYFSPLKTFTKKIKDAISNGTVIYKVSSPDVLDNLPKLLFDCLNKIIIVDDSKIVRGNNIMKIYSNNPGVFIKLKGEL